jgi:hypothetical protein
MPGVERSMLIPQRIGIVLSNLLFGLPALLLWARTDLLIPPLVPSGWSPQIAWFLAGSLVLVPLLVAALAGAWAALPAPSLMTIDHLRISWRSAGCHDGRTAK